MKKAQGLPINIIVMLILGLILFGLGIGLFFNIYDFGNDNVEFWNKNILTGIQSLECDGADWICSPAYEIRNGQTDTYQLFIANKGDDNQKFKISFFNLSENRIESDDCGFIEINYPDFLINILTGESAQIPFIVKARNVNKFPCSFIGTVKLLDESNQEIDRTSIIIKVK